MYNIFADLQMFADGAGTLVNATGSYVNAYTGVTTAFEGKNTLDPQLKTYYDTELLENARVDMVYAQFAKKQPLPANHGKTVEWRKWNTFEKAGQLQEGVIPTGQKFGSSVITGSINQYGTYTAVTDILEMRGFDDVIIGATEEMGASASETQEKLIRDALLVNSNTLYCDNITLATGAVSGATPTSTAQMEASTTTMALLTDVMVNKAATQLKKNNVPTINGKFYVSAYDRALSKYALYKIATATTSISKVAEITSETRSQATYNTSGLHVKSNTKGVVIRNGQKFPKLDQLVMIFDFFDEGWVQIPFYREFKHENK